MTTTLPYPIITPTSPILTLHVKNMDLADVLSVGETALYIKRTGDYAEYAKYYPFEERGNRLSFAFDNVLFARPTGRFEGRLVYKGVTLETTQFIYKANVVEIIGSTNV